MGAEGFDLPVSQEDLRDDEKKTSKNRFDSNNVSFKRMSLYLSKHKKLITILVIVLFLTSWFSDSSSSYAHTRGSVNYDNNSHSASKSYESLPPNMTKYQFNWWNPISWFWNPDPKIVIILAANQGGGVLRWKTEQDWSIEHLSIGNKKAYARRHGYGLTIKDLTTLKRYSHEFRESWQKVDILKQTLREYPNAEWFWWLDLETLIMEPSFSLDDHIFSRLDTIADRSLKNFNPLNIEVDIPYIDYKQDLNLLITQDCGGFNLGSFFIRNSEWSKALLDIWFEPIAYEQKHMEWEHKEQDALENLYASQPWIRSGIAFLPLRTINAFPPGACSDFSDDPRYFYKQSAKDFVVNMAGCNYGRDCWGEMSYYLKKMERSNAKWYTRNFFKI
ncbi:hypothetical protein TPHA_0L01220 [Tetrapisispora phaffii CBS 4417]|uniref:Alpha-1,6-mannosyltransferase n=1 Tax=Tetrapisispora phaffii (strain ATCC 24235 / CBS 4417 / NBRC 1672 / NRRL Y-8282 / UCD 70-5) TaxID=1071381 RepID=G8C001_TETPH|nr:hypothetical protein TPHA_0L01220 [Tetrapisispora phaffii CBS 4417]CCE65479.1 hypothetical protein TPHA_0L01220 [Tetrapisispora phaffii CBS 4417]